MAYPARALPLLTAEEFLAQRHTFPGKVELVHGIVYPMYDDPDRLMTGGTDKHNKVTVNAIGALLPVARQLGCELYANDMGVLVDGENIYYPDVMATCDP